MTGGAQKEFEKFHDKVMELIDAKDYYKLQRLVGGLSFNIDKYHPETIMGVLSWTYIVRDKIPGWERSRDDIAWKLEPESLEKRKQLLSGL